MRPIYPILTSIINSGAAPTTIIECGAHDGSDSYQLRRSFPQAKIFSFEPDPRNLKTIQDRRIDQLTGLIPAAVGDKDGMTAFHLSSANMAKKHPAWLKNEQWAGSSSLKRPTGHLRDHPWCEFNTTIEVPIIRLDTFLARAKLDSIDLIWADVQGAEDLVIAGGQATLAATNYLYTEYSNSEVYETQINLDQIIRSLPGQWDILRQFPDDVLLRNTTRLGPLSAPESAILAQGSPAPARAAS